MQDKHKKVWMLHLPLHNLILMQLQFFRSLIQRVQLTQLRSSSMTAARMASDESVLRTPLTPTALHNTLTLF